MDLSTNYLGLQLRNPVIVASSPISKKVDEAKKAEAAGAAAIVMYSLFEEQIQQEQKALDKFLNANVDCFSEALSYFPEPASYANIDAEAYIKHLEQVKRGTSIPVIGSLNGVSSGGWMKYAKRMEEAGADAIELNVFYVPANLELSPSEIEDRYIDNLRAIKSEVKIPVAVKLSPFFTALGHFAKRLNEAGADGLVLFNRFFCPDIDLEKLEVTPQLFLSDKTENRLVLRWIAILHGHMKANICATSGIRDAEDVLKMMMAGANAVAICSVLLQNGPAHIAKILDGMRHWMADHEYTSIEQMRGSMSYRSVAEPSAYERANYMKTIQLFE
ncbi:MAG: dihydroorotate dehydrogenase-like protein [Deltaproteobacteria bacterium]|nr:dihydroorotate dehydrogenase-like protein [Deltaproteobacteria bacterium]